MNKGNNTGKCFVLPFLIVFLIFTIVPLIFTFLISFTNYDRFTWSFIGLANYKNVIVDPVFWQSFMNTWIIWGIGFIGQIVFAMLVATLLTDVRLRIKGVGLFRTIFFLPNLMATASIAVLFSLLLGSNDTSILNSLLLNLHIIDAPIGWLDAPLTARLSISAINTWIWFGNTAILIMAGMTSISTDIFESAWLDGANRFQVYWNITLPSIKPTLTYVLVTSIIGGMQTFDLPYLMPSIVGGPDGSLTTMGVYLYQNAFTWLNVGYAGALSIIMFLIIAGFSVILRRVLRED